MDVEAWVMTVVLSNKQNSEVDAGAGSTRAQPLLDRVLG
jgi:hypothetical protein